MTTVEIKTGLGHTVTTSVYKAENPTSTLIMASATGVKQLFYKNFAEFICSKGITVITFDYIGIGQSLKVPLKSLKNTASDWGQTDLEAVIQYAKSEYPSLKINLLGHSIGGQLIGLAKSSSEAQKVILVAAQSGYWKFWEGLSAYKMWVNWYLLFPFLTALFGYMPSKKLTGMENLPKYMTKEWVGWCKSENYLFDFITEEKLFYENIRSEMMVISVEKDKFAPKAAVDKLASAYKNARIKRMHLSPENYDTKSIGHFGIFRKQYKDELWEMLFREMV